MDGGFYQKKCGRAGAVRAGSTTTFHQMPVFAELNLASADVPPAFFVKAQVQCAISIMTPAAYTGGA